jgi:hypothetical protein
VFWSLPQKEVEFLELPGTPGDHPNRGNVAEVPRETLDQSSNQAQEFLLLRSVTSRDQKGSELNVCDLST